MKVILPLPNQNDKIIPKRIVINKKVFANNLKILEKYNREIKLEESKIKQHVIKCKPIVYKKESLLSASYIINYIREYSQVNFMRITSTFQLSCDASVYFFNSLRFTYIYKNAHVIKKREPITCIRHMSNINTLSMIDSKSKDVPSKLNSNGITRINDYTEVQIINKKQDMVSLLQHTISQQQISSISRIEKPVTNNSSTYKNNRVKEKNKVTYLHYCSLISNSGFHLQFFMIADIKVSLVYLNINNNIIC